MLSRFTVCEASVVIITKFLFHWSLFFPISEPPDTQENTPANERNTEAGIDEHFGLGESVFHILDELLLSGDGFYGVNLGFFVEGKIKLIKFAFNKL